MQYNKSPKHYQNLEKARVAATRRSTCEYCSGSFTLGNINKHKRACKKNPRNVKVCPACGGNFTGLAQTCSRGCANTYFKSGPNHGNWKDDRYRTTCFHYHEKKCVVCPETVIVEVHHLDEDHTNNTPENLIPLCPTHHQYWHSRHRYLIEERVDNYLNLWKNGRGGRI